MGEAKRKQDACDAAQGGWSRRGVIGALIGGLGLPLWWWSTRSAVSPASPSPASPSPASPSPVGARPVGARPPEWVALEATLETLLPGGEFPGHRETGVLTTLWSVAEGNGALRAKFQEGARLLDEAGGGSGRFAAAGPTERARILQAFAHAAPATPQHAYYRFLRDQAMRLHYTHPASWGPLGFSQAPQPQGYPDYRQAPRG